MTETEKNIIDEILAVKDVEGIGYETRRNISKSLEKFFKQINSFDDISDDFTNHIALQKYLSKVRKDSEIDKYVALWLYIAGYLKNKSGDKLKAIESLLKDYLKMTMGPEEKASGMALLSHRLWGFKNYKN